MLNVVYTEILCVTNKPFMLSVIMLNVIMLSVLMLSVKAPTPGVVFTTLSSRLTNGPNKLECFSRVNHIIMHIT
jgi:hypothetical protein